MGEDNSLPMQVTVACATGVSPQFVAHVFKELGLVVTLGQGLHVNGIPLNTVVIE